MCACALPFGPDGLLHSQAGGERVLGRWAAGLQDLSWAAGRGWLAYNFALLPAGTEVAA